ncbi:MAG TPA: hypothetical protein P5216_00420 [Bacteroidota bacterium]|nr:hypothetical protein [Bacteroidota bacterium]
MSFEIFTGVHSKKEDIINEFDNYLNSKNNNFFFVYPFSDKNDELLNHLVSELNFKIIDINEQLNNILTIKGNLIHSFNNIIDNLLNESQNSNDKYLIKFNNPILFEPDILEATKKLGEIIWLYNPIFVNESINETFFNYSDYIFILSDDLEESKERIVSEIERII